MNHSMLDLPANQLTQFERSNLSRSQYRLWLSQQAAGNVPLDSMAMVFFFGGTIDPERFSAALHELVQRSDSLRTIISVKDGIPYRSQRKTNATESTLVDLSSSATSRAIVLDWAYERVQKPFNPEISLFDSVLIRMPEDRWAWYFNQNHLITDGITTLVHLQRLNEIYLVAEASRSPQKSDYDEFVKWERTQSNSEGFVKAQKYWANLDAPDPMRIYGLEPSGQHTRSTRLMGEFPPESFEQLKALASLPKFASLTPQFSLFNLIATLLFAHLHRVTGDSSLQIGTPWNLRQGRRFREATGLFIEILPLAIRVDVDDTFESLHKKVLRESLQLMQHARPGASSLTRHQHPSVVLNLPAVKFPEFAGHPIEAEWVHCGHSAPEHSVRLEVIDFAGSGLLKFAFDLNEEAFPGELGTTFTRQFRTVLEAFLSNPTQRINDFAIVEQVDEDPMKLGNLSASESSITKLNTLPERLAQIVSLTPQRIAACSEGQKLSYESLLTQANDLASRLRETGVGPDSMVAFYTNRSVDLVTGIVGILQAGAAYLPLNPNDPPLRLRDQIEAAAATTIVTQTPLPKELESATNSIIPLYSSRLENQCSSPDNVAPELSPDNLAYVIFTSGSTGKPKAIQVEHRQVQNLIEGLQTQIYQRHLERDIGSSDRHAIPPINIALLAAHTFDASVQQIFASLFLGQTLHIAPETARRDGGQLLKWLTQNKIDVTDGTPNHLRMLLGADERKLHELCVKDWIIGGEALPKDLAIKFLSALGEPKARVTNVYGPAECCVDSLSWTISPKTLDAYPSVPIGLPLPGVHCHIVNQYGHQQVIGVAGELLIGGKGVSRGYRNVDPQTQPRFAPSTFTPGETVYHTGDLVRLSPKGLVEFIGREDRQVKVRGYRIELGEIELAIKSYGKNELTDAEPGTTASAKSIHTERCKKCLLTIKHPDVELDETGICNVCRDFASRHSKALDYFRSVDEFGNLMQRIRSQSRSDYDCLLLYSGGKDSSYVLYRLAEMGFRILAYTFDNGHISKAAFENIKRQTTKLGVECFIDSTPNMDEIFLESLNTDSTVCSGCFKSLTTLSTKIALTHQIPAIITGLSRGQILDTKISGLIDQGIVDVSEMEKHLQSFRQAFHAKNDRTTELLGHKIANADLQSIEFIDFFRYDDVSTLQIKAYLAERDEFWRVPADTGFCSSNCLMNDIGICVHSSERGYHNYEAPLSWEIRLGTIEREQGMSEIAPVRNLNRVQTVLKNIGFKATTIDQALVVPHRTAEGTTQLFAFYSANRAVSAKQLREHLSSRLPSYMLPAKFQQLDAFPVTANGKVDQKALTLDSTQSSSHSDYDPPRDDRERLLASIWQSCLQIERVGINDNFFDLGGDSIVAIQIVAQAKKLGISLTPNQLFAHQTIAELTDLDTTQTLTPAAEPASGNYPLTPIQRFFFAQRFPQPNVWNLTALVAAPTEIEHSDLEWAITHLTEHHDCLRTAFRQHEGDWLAEILEEVPAPTILSSDATNLSRTEGSLHNSLSLESGKLLGAALLQDKVSPKILLVVHHLVTDAISLSILLSDLFDLLRASRSGTEAILPLRTDSFKRWAEHLTEEAELLGENCISYWRNTAQAPFASIPRCIPNGSNSEASAATAKQTLSLAASEKLFTRQTQTDKASPEELILAATIQSLASWTGRGDLAIEVEGHGRGNFAQEFNLVRTVGWFTSLYPLKVKLSDPTDSESVLREVQTRHREAPHHGASFGILRYLHPEAAVRDSLAAPHEPEVMFSYFGQSKSFTGGTRFIRPMNLLRGSANQRPRLLEINAIQVDRCLQIEWRYSRNLHKGETINHYLAKCITTLEEQLAGTDSDIEKFPHASLNKRKLGKLNKALSRLK